jgi:uncharacterized protein (TIGR02145 family)
MNKILLLFAIVVSNFCFCQNAAKLLSVSAFKNGEAVNEAKSPAEWEQYSMNSQPVFMKKFIDGNEYFFYNWYAISDLRGVVDSKFIIPDQFHLTILNANSMLPIVPIGIISEQGHFTKLSDQQYYWTNSEFTEKGNRESAVSVSISSAYKVDTEAKKAFKQEGFLVWVIEKEKLTQVMKESAKVIVDSKKSSSTTNTNTAKTETNSTISITPISTLSANDYKSVKIGNQVWMTENLNVDRFRNGDLILEARTKEEWVLAGKNKKPAWCYYDNDPKNGEKYGKLYNWYAVNDPRGLAPKGWHIPSDNEWITLTYYLGGDKVAGEKMKSTSGWKENGNGTNSSGFSGLPGGRRFSNGTFYNFGDNCYWWSSKEENSNLAWNRNLSLYLSNGYVYWVNTNEEDGFSVRCLRD